MYNEDIRDLQKQKIIYNLKMVKEFLSVYVKMILIMPKESLLQKKLLFLLKEWFLYSKREQEVLNVILRDFGNIEDDLDVEEVLANLDEIFENMFDYYDEILDGYENMLSTKDIYRSNYNEPDFELLTEDKKKSLIKIITYSMK